MGRTLENNETDALARAAHEVNRSWNAYAGLAVDKSWEQMTEIEKAFARSSVFAIITHDFSAEKTHEAWMATKQVEGWTYGAVKSEARKEHPCMVPFNQLPVEQQAKDLLWVDTVKSFANHLWKTKS